MNSEFSHKNIDLIQSHLWKGMWGKQGSKIKENKIQREIVLKNMEVSSYG